MNCSVQQIASVRQLLVAVALLVVGLSVVPAHAETPTAEDSKHPLVVALQHAKSSLKTVEAAKDYQAEFLKRDIVNGQVYAHTTFMKFRVEPMSAYLKFKEPHEGREVIYVHGKNDGKLLAHETGIKSIVGTVALLPTSSQAMSESKHPITEIGIAKLVGGIIQHWEREIKFGEIDVKYYPKAKHTLFGKQEHLVIEATHPRPRKQFEYHRARLWIDRKTNLPVRVAYWGFPRRAGAKPPLLEEYTYRNVELDVGLEDIDFDVSNPKYDF